MTLEVTKYSLLITGTIILIGGIIGFRKAKSKASLIAGIVSCILLDLCFALSFMLPLIGFMAGFLVLCCLDIVFFVRLLKVKKFMPAGMLLLICAAEQVLLVFGALNLDRSSF